MIHIPLLITSLFGCFEESPQHSNVLAVDNDGDGYSEFYGDVNDNDATIYPGSEYIHKNECPDTTIQVDPNVIEVVCPDMPEINLSCPEIPECPEPIVNVDCPEPVLNVSVESPTVNVAGPDMSQIANSFDDLSSAMLEVADAVEASGSGNKEYFAMGGTCSAAGIVWTNNDDRTFIVTAIATSGNNSIHIAGINNGIIYHAGSSLYSYEPGLAQSGNMMLPVQSGETVECPSDGFYYFFQGYYIDMQ